MGFKTLAIQKRSGEVWKTLNEAKVEFEKYATWVDKVKRNIEAAQKTLDEAQTRTRAVNRKLKHVDGTLSDESDSLDMNTLPHQIIANTSDEEIEEAI